MPAIRRSDCRTRIRGAMPAIRLIPPPATPWGLIPPGRGIGDPGRTAQWRSRSVGHGQAIVVGPESNAGNIARENRGGLRYGSHLRVTPSSGARVAGEVDAGPTAGRNSASSSAPANQSSAQRRLEWCASCAESLQTKEKPMTQRRPWRRPRQRYCRRPTANSVSAERRSHLPRHRSRDTPSPIQTTQTMFDQG